MIFLVKPKDEVVVEVEKPEEPIPILSESGYIYGKIISLVLQKRERSGRSLTKQPCSELLEG